MDLYQRIAKLPEAKRKLLEKKLRQQDIDVLEIPVTPVSEKEVRRFPLSFMQEPIWMADRLHPGTTAYNIVRTTILTGKPDIDALNKSVGEIVRRHSILRARFLLENDRPVQEISPEPLIEKGFTDLSHLSPEQRDESLQQTISGESHHSFDLSTGPLLRTCLIKLENSKHVFLVVTHHIVADGTSIQVFIRDMVRIYRELTEGGNLPEAPLQPQYTDYVMWQRQWLGESGNRSVFFKKQEQFWNRQFSNGVPALELPVDFPRPRVPDFEGGTVGFHLEKSVSGKLKSFTASKKTTLYTVLLAFYNILLAKLSGKDDIVVGTPVAGRRHPDTRHMMGTFVNMLPMRLEPDGSKGWNDFMEEVKDYTLEAFENQEYQSGELSEHLTAGDARTGLFDVVMLVKNVDYATVQLPDLSLETIPHESETSKFDLTLTAWEANDEIHLTFDYARSLFKESTIQRFARYFQNIVTSVLSGPSVLLSEIDYIPREELNDLLYKFNDTDAGYPEEKTVHGLFEEQASRTPGAVALVDPETDLHITYGELNRRAGHLAVSLQARGVVPDTIIALLLKPSPEMLIAILGTLKSGGAYLPMDPGYPEERIQYMLRDSQSPITLTIDDIICTDAANDAQSPRIDANHAAYIIYTSGTTGKPKGAVIEHRNVVRLLFNDRNLFDFTHRDTWTLFHSYCFDFSVWEMYGALLYGGKLIVIPRNIARDTAIFLEILKKQCVTILNQTPSAFYSLSDRELDHPRKDLHLRYIVFGGEALTPARLREWYGRYPATRLINMYGITETTVHVTFKEIGEKEIADNISNIGVPIPTLKTYILGKYLNPVPVGVPGELIVAGHGVGRGYLNRPELTHEKFINIQDKNFWESRTLFIKRVLAAGGKLYKSGDLARWTSDGEMEYLGRIDSQVKIRGFRIELGEIESRILSYPGVKEAVVLSRRDDRGDHYLCAYIVGGIEGLNRYLNGFLPDYMIPAYFISLDKLPLTPNGKIDRKALPEPEISTTQQRTAPRDALETKLLDVFNETLAVPSEAGIGIDDSFFELGGQSLKAIRLTSVVKSEFNIDIPLAEIFQNPTVRELARVIRQSETTVYQPIERAPRQEYYPLSSSQERMFILNQFISYNINMVLKISGELDKSRFESAFRELIRRHDSLRTTFHVEDGVPVQKIHDDVAFELQDFTQSYDLYDQYDLLDLYKSFAGPMDISQAPLLRVGLMQGPTGQFISINIHHMIFDGTSLGILSREFLRLYNGGELPGLTVQYKDFAQWERERFRSGSLYREHESYWLERFGGEIPVLNIATDFPRPTVQRFEGDVAAFRVEGAGLEALNRFSLANGVSLFMVLTAVYNILLYRYSGQEDIVFGTIAAGREHRDVENMVGNFINTLSIRNFPTGDISFLEFLGSVKQGALEAFQHQSYPFGDLLDKLEVKKDLSRTPLFDVMFIMQNYERPSLEMGDLRLSPYIPGGDDGYPEESAGIHVQHDIILWCFENPDSLDFRLEYCTALFKPETMQRWVEHFLNILESVIHEPGTRLGEIEFIGEGEKHQILEQFNHPPEPFESEKTLHELFTRQAKRTPGRVAVRTVSGDITYGELDRRSDALAARLIQRGVRPGNIVALQIGPSIEMFIGIFGTFKTGAAHLPIAPNTPDERVRYMIRDSQSPITLTIGNINQMLNEPASGGASIQPAASFCYIIYTSGSTGKPKGVMLSHRNMMAYLHAYFNVFPITGDDIVIQMASYTFDMFMEEVYPLLLRGGRVVVPELSEKMDINYLCEYIREQRVTIVDCTPLLLNEFNHAAVSGKAVNPLETVHTFISGGDVLKPQYVDNLVKFAKVYNTYGPTESTICITYQRFTGEETEANIPIGKPITNYSVYILSSNHQLQPIGVPGELYVAGPGVAPGYLNNPEQTQEMFTHSKFKIQNSKLYKSGDLCRWLGDGSIEFLGRVDRQVKIRGYRVEIKEIEQQLVLHDSIGAAVVLAWQDTLAAFVVFSGNSDTSGGEIREYLGRWLPEYMVPSQFIVIQKFPLTINRKVDEAALRNLIRQDTGEEEYVAPVGEIETKLARMWGQLLEMERVGVYDNFFQLGGHSLLAMRLLSQVKEEFNIQIPLVDFFRFNTVRGIAELINKRQAAVEDKKEPAGEERSLSNVAFTKRKRRAREAGK